MLHASLRHQCNTDVMSMVPLVQWHGGAKAALLAQLRLEMPHVPDNIDHVQVTWTDDVDGVAASGTQTAAPAGPAPSGTGSASSGLGVHHAPAGSEIKVS